MYKLCRKLRILKQHLRVFNLQKYSNLIQRVEDARDAMNTAQLALEKTPMNTVLREEEQETTEKFRSLQSLLLAQQRQQAKVLWMQEGDRSSRYSHAIIRKRSRGNKIHMLEHENGISTTDQD